LRRFAAGFKSRVRLRSVAWLAVVALLTSWPSWAGGADAPCRPADPGASVPVDFRDIDLGTVGRYVSCVAGVAFVYSPSELRSRRITVFAPRPVPVDRLIRIFEVGLRGHGLFMEKHGAYYVIRAADQRPSKSRSTKGR
jgi:type II secretory pathway component GspD/PulD (secretin)